MLSSHELLGFMSPKLAQEIITDQQSEIELMQRWLKQQQPNQAKENQTAAANTGKDN